MTGPELLTDREPIGAPRPAGTNSLGGRAARGAAITLAGQAARILLQTASVVVLARILVPKDYGLMAMVLVVVGVGEILRDFGLSMAAIRAPELSAAQQNNLFWVNGGIGLVLSLVAFSAAGLFAEIFNQPALTGMVRVLCITFTVNGLASQYRADLNRRMLFGRLSVSDVAGQAVGLGVAVTSAVLGAGYWALVAQQLTQVTTALVLLVVFAGWLPRAPRRSVDIRPFLRVGWNLMATQAIYYLSNNLDTITIGLRFSSSTLGLYNRGFQLVMTPLNQLRSPATTVALPVLTRLHGDYQRAGEYIRRSQLALGYTIVAGLSIGAGAATPVVALLLGSKWAHVVPVFSLLAIAGACSTLSYVGFWVYVSRGLTRDLMRYTLVTLVLQALCIVIGSQWGMVGVAAGYAVAAGLEWPLSLTWLSRITVIPLHDLMHGALRIVSCAFLAGIAAAAAAHATNTEPAIIGCLAAAAAGVGVYGAAVLLAHPVRADLAGVAAFGRRVARG